MNIKTIEILEFSKIKTTLAGLAGSSLGRQMAEKLTPSIHLSAIRNILRETSEARQIIDSAGSPPMHGLTDIGESLERIKKGGILEPGALTEIGDFLRGCRKTKEFMKKRLELAPMVAGYAEGINVFPEVEDEISRCICDGMVSSEASSRLKKVRHEMERIREKIRSKLEHIIMSAEAKIWLQESVISLKDSCQVLMVKASYKDKLPGIVHGSSGSGSTLFVEPHSVHQLNNELRVLEGVEQEEIYQVLAGLSGQVAVKVNEIESNLEIMSQYDFAFAKARLSRMMNAIEPLVNQGEYIKLIGARHPLLNDPVPLNFNIGKDYRSLIITGPNTGGKTVAMKTIGLLTIMMQTGLHVPVANGSEMAVFTDVLADIGDGQDIKQSLSTFSAHITNIIGILGECGPGTLVLLDEVGTGTDPVEGSVLAMAILEYLYEKRSITIASTHYPELKQYAIDTPGFKNGCMAFDRVNLRPLYSLIIGQSGESNALWIAEKLGLPDDVLEKAKKRLKFTSPSQPELITSLAEPQIEPDEEKEDNEILSPVMVEPPVTIIPPKNEAVEKVIKIGDLVAIPFLREKGVVCTAPDAKGRIRVLVKGKKMDIPVKRVNILVAAEQLYPENYDLDIVFLSKEDRQLKKKMNKGHIPGLTRIVAPEEQARKS